MRYWVGITDNDWFSFLAARPELPEVNFWQPSATAPARFVPGELFLFKLHARRADRRRRILRHLLVAPCGSGLGHVW